MGFRTAAAAAALMWAGANGALADMAQGVTPYPAAYFAAAQPVSAYDMIVRLPGFTFAGGDTVRGFEGAAGNVLIDGQRPSSKSDSLEELLKRLPASQVERIDVIRGGAPGIDMQGKSVLANVVRKAGGGFTGLFANSNTVVVHDGRYLKGARLEGSRTTADSLLEGSILYGQGADDGAGDGFGLILPAGGGTPRAYDLWTEGNAGNGAAVVAYERNAFGGRVRLNARAFMNPFEYDETRRDRDSGALSTEHDDQDYYEYEAGLRFTRPVGPRGEVETLVLQTFKQNRLAVDFATPDAASTFSLKSDSGETIGRAVAKYRRSQRLSFEAGGEGAFNWLESETGYAIDGESVPLPAANVRVEETRGELFVAANGALTRTVTVEGRLRAEGSRIVSDGDVTLEKTLTFVKPRLAATWSPSEAWQVRGRIEREVGQLNFDDFVASSAFNTGGVQTGNPDLEPEQAWVAEIAVERRFWTSGSLVLTVRHARLTDVADRAPVFVLDDPSTPQDESDVFDQPANIGDGTKTEYVADLTLPLDRLGVKRGLLKTQATWRDARVTDPTTGQDREISGLHPLDWEAHFTQDLPRWHVNWGVDVSGAWRETFYRFDRVDSFKLRTFVTPFAEYKPRRDLILRLELQNITSRGFEQVSDVYDAPRSAAPLKYREVRDRQFGPMIFFRIRKILG